MYGYICDVGICLFYSSAEMYLINLTIYSIDLSYCGILSYGKIFPLESHGIHHTKQLHNVS